MTNKNKLKEVRDYIEKVGLVNVEELKRRFDMSSGELNLALLILEQTGSIKKMKYKFAKCEDCTGCSLRSVCHLKGGKKDR